MGAQVAGPGLAQRDLAGAGSRLALVERQRLARKAQNAAAQSDGAGGNDDDVAALSLERGNILGQSGEPFGPQLAGFPIDQKGRADLDDEPLVARQGVETVDGLGLHQGIHFSWLSAAEDRAAFSALWSSTSSTA